VFQFGLSLILSAGPALVGVLHALRAARIRDQHAELWADPLAPPRSRAQRRHLREVCGECSLIAEMISSRLA
jgi:hypothetical protein